MYLDNIMGLIHQLQREGYKMQTISIFKPFVFDPTIEKDKTKA